MEQRERLRAVLFAQFRVLKTMRQEVKIVRWAVCFAAMIVSGLHSAFTQEVTEAAEREFSKSKANLESRFEKLLFRLPGEKEREMWGAAHQMWLKFSTKEAEAKAGLTSGGGSSFSLDYLVALTNMNDDRSKYYASILVEKE